jgi:hypothetical protein
LVGLVSLAALASAALVRPGPFWLSVVVSLTLIVLVVQTLRTMLCNGEARATAIGWLVFAVAYLAIAIGPWLGDHVGPQLATSKGLDYAQQKWRKQASEAQSADYLRRLGLDLVGVNLLDGTTSTIWMSDNRLPYSLALNSATGTTSPTVNCFRLSGHWLFAWLAGWLGSVLAVHFYRRSHQLAVQPA